MDTQNAETFAVSKSELPNGQSRGGQKGKVKIYKLWEVRFSKFPRRIFWMVADTTLECLEATRKVKADTEADLGWVLTINARGTLDYIPTLSETIKTDTEPEKVEDSQ